MVLTLITICLGITSVVFSYTIKNQDESNEIEVQAFEIIYDALSSWDKRTFTEIKVIDISNDE